MTAMDDDSTTDERGQGCGNCRFWKRAAGGDQHAGWGQCRRMPPTLPDVADDKLVHVGVWPHTDRADWCGEWQGA